MSHPVLPVRYEVDFVTQLALTSLFRPQKRGENTLFQGGIFCPVAGITSGRLYSERKDDELHFIVNGNQRGQAKVGRAI
jgi:hypothetical protein